LNPVLEMLLQARQSLPNSVNSQLIHADLTGNILFDGRETPAIIDLTLYWRPARYAEAIVIAGCLTWHGKGEDAIQYYGADDVGRQLLLRALYWRCLTYAIDPWAEWTKHDLFDLTQRHMKAAEMVCNYLGP
jgi:hypothetical protein